MRKVIRSRRSYNVIILGSSIVGAVARSHSCILALQAPPYIYYLGLSCLNQIPHLTRFYSPILSLYLHLIYLQKALKYYIFLPKFNIPLKQLIQKIQSIDGIFLIIYYPYINWKSQLIALALSLYTPLIPIKYALTNNLIKTNLIRKNGFAITILKEDLVKLV